MRTRLWRVATFVALAGAHSACICTLPARPDDAQRTAEFARWPAADQAPFDPILVSERCVILGREGARAFGVVVWQPSVSDVLAAEDVVPELLAEDPRTRDLAPGCRRDHRRQWAGVTRRGRRVLVGNFIRPAQPMTDDWTWWPEGGWRIELDADTHEVVFVERSRIPRS